MIYIALINVIHITRNSPEHTLHCFSVLHAFGISRVTRMNSLNSIPARERLNIHILSIIYLDDLYVTITIIVTM